MNRIRSLAIGAILMFALAMLAQQNTSKPGSAAKAAHDGGMPTVDEQLKVLTEKLDLTGDQQAKVKPILQDLHDATVKLMQDKRLSHEERLARVRPRRYKANDQIRELLSDEQKKKLDLYLQGPHPEMHGNLTGTTPSPARPPQL